MANNETNGGDVNAAGRNGSASAGAAGKDFSELKKEQMLKTLLIEQLSKEESSLSNYKFEKDKPESNAVLHYKEDVDSPILRLDAILDYNVRSLYDTLNATDMIHLWFGERCILSKLVEQ